MRLEDTVLVRTNIISPIAVTADKQFTIFDRRHITQEVFDFQKRSNNRNTATHRVL